jgi:hypothetical protein
MVTFMCCVLILRPTPSHHSTQRQHRFVHTLCAQVIPCRNELLHIFARKGCLVVYLPEWVGEESVSIFNIKTAQETNIPISIPFVYVGMGWVAMLLYHISSGRSPTKNHLA